jgi:tRNA(fMet)-specific endonuclease VapC
MILLDTDHFSVLKYLDQPKFAALAGKMQIARDQVAITIVSAEEQMRGWLAKINRLHNVDEQIPVYDELGKLFAFLKDWEVIPFDARAAGEFMRLRRQGVRIGSLDLIASIALVQGATLLSANVRDFRKVPGLKVENWLD